jgi:integrase/recombinase XerD
VLGADEIVRFLEAVPSLKARVALTTAYAAGSSEPQGRQNRQQPHGHPDRAGKGGRDRYVMLSPQLLGILRSYRCIARPAHSL